MSTLPWRRRADTAEVLDRLGVKDFARVAQLPAKEAFRLLQVQYRQDGEAPWARFEAELAKLWLPRFNGQGRTHCRESMDVAGVVVFLASGAASLITGETILIDGGWTAR
jgi:NAD(P)-dependent dehydrogenase (short-subunit alcohol dehydrogenase family)